MTNQQELLEQAKLNWTVKKESLRTVESGIIVPQTYALIREDSLNVLGTCGPNYEVYQNHELMDLMHKVSHSTGLSLHSGGSFEGGKLVYIQLKSSEHKLPGNDKVEAFITSLNSFNKSKALAIGDSFNTVSCMNTFMKVYSEIQTKIFHNSMLRPKIEEILKQVDVLLEEEKNTFKEIEQLGNFKMDEATELMVMSKLFDLEKEDKIIPVDELSTYALNKIGEFYDVLSLELQQKGDNLWGLFNGVTRYTTHVLKNGNNGASKMFGTVGSKEKSIYKYLLEVATA